MVKRTAMLAVAAVAGAVISGCTINVGNHSPASTAKVSKDDLQKDITQRITSAGQAPQSVSCPGDLAGNLGNTIRCDVTMGATSSFESVVTVTGVEGTRVDYDITPGVSKTQLESSVSRMLANASQAPITAVSCDSGLEGKPGAVAYCNVTTAGAVARRAVEVTGVSGLAMRYHVVPILPKSVAEGSLLFQLKQAGQHPDSATCGGDLEGKPGNTLECTTVSAGQTQTYVLTVTTVDGDNITYKYALKT